MPGSLAATSSARGVAVGVGVAEDVDRVAVAPVGRQEAVEAAHASRAKARRARRRRRSGRRWPARPGPPALVTIASRGPLGRGCLASTSAM